MRWAEDYELQTTALSRLTRIHSYAILCLHLYWAASSMAEQAPLKRKVQGSTPWQPTSHSISDERYLNLILPKKFRADTNVSRML